MELLHENEENEIVFAAGDPEVISLGRINPFLLEPILRVLFRGLSVKELKVCRLVCLKWEGIARECLSGKVEVRIGAVEKSKSKPRIFTDEAEFAEYLIRHPVIFPDFALKDGVFKTLILSRDPRIAMEFKNMAVNTIRSGKLGTEILRVPEISVSLEDLTLALEYGDIDWLQKMSKRVKNLRRFSLVLLQEESRSINFPIEGEEWKSDSVQKYMASFHLRADWIKDREKPWLPFLTHVLVNAAVLRELGITVCQLFHIHPRVFEDIAASYSGPGLDRLKISDASSGRKDERCLESLKVFLKSTAASTLKLLDIKCWALTIGEWRKAFECMGEKQCRLLQGLYIIVSSDWNATEYNIEMNSEGYRNFSEHPNKPNALDLFSLFPSYYAFPILHTMHLQFKCRIHDVEPEARFLNVDTREKSSTYATRNRIFLNSRKCFPSVQELVLNIDVTIVELEVQAAGHVIHDCFQNFKYNFPNLRKLTLTTLYQSILDKILNQLPSSLESFRAVGGGGPILKDEDFIRDGISLLPKYLQCFEMQSISFNFTNLMIFNGLLQLEKLRVVHLGNGIKSQLNISADAIQALDTTLNYFVYIIWPPEPGLVSVLKLGKKKNDISDEDCNSDTYLSWRRHSSHQRLS